jgi:predicted PurR-regulated permease PerM
MPFNTFFKKIKFKKKHLPAGGAAFLTLITLYFIFTSLFMLFVPLVADEAKIISGIDPQKVVSELQGPLHSAESLFQKYSSDTISLQQYAIEKLSSLFNAGQVTNIANSMIAFAGNIFIAFFAISFFTFFFLKDGRRIMETLLLLFPDDTAPHVRVIAHDSKHLLTRYFTGICIDVLCVTFLVSLGLYIAGVGNAFIIGFFAGIMNIIPYVGPLIAALVGLVVAVSANLQMNISSELPVLCIKVLAVFIATDLLDAFLVQPLIFSKRVHAHPLEIFIVVLMAGTIGGIGGMIVAVPCYTVLRLIAKEFFNRFRIVDKLTKNLTE